MSEPSTATAARRTPCAATTAAEIGDGHVPYGRIVAEADTSAANEAERQIARLTLAQRGPNCTRRQRVKNVWRLKVPCHVAALEAINRDNPVLPRNQAGQPERTVLS